MNAAVTTKTVLIVDDNPALTELFGEVLSESFHVRAANSIAEALAELKGGNIDAVISDYHIGPQDADTLITWILARQPNLAGKIILITGELQLNLSHVKQLSTVLYKPVGMAALLATVQALFDQSEGI